MNYLVIGLYVISFALFIYGLMGLTGPKTAVRGNLIAATGMALAVTATLIKIRHTDQWWWIIAGLVVGVVLGVPPARYTKMTAMPQLVAFFNGVGGGTVALIALAEFIETDGFSAFQHGESPTAHIVVASLFAAIIGSISFWGSIIAFGKLQEILPGRPIGLGKAQQPVNLLLLAAAIVAAVVIGLGARPGSGGVSLWWMIGLLAASGALGLMVVLPIGGADMPVVISLLNAFTGTAVAMAGFVIGNWALIIAGALVGASGGILTKLMADAMNRSLRNIMIGGFGTGDSAVAVEGPGGDVRSIAADDAAIQLAYAQKVIIVPGYGLAAAQAQHQLAELAKELEKHGIEVSYAIHPVAGRMPGHMNVLLAEANVPYPQLKEMEEINPEFPRADVALVVGANDVTNPAARRPGTAISGMPILDVDQAKSIIVIKRSMASGYAGIDNELYVDPKTSMYFADAKKALSELTAAVKTLVG